MSKRRIGFMARHRSEDDPAPLSTSPAVGSIMQLSDSPPEAEAAPEQGGGPYEVRLTVNGGTLQSIEPHPDLASIWARAEQIVGRLGYDGNLRSLAIVIEIPQLEALKASRDAINRAIAEATKL